MKNIFYFLTIGILLYSCMDAQEKQLLGKWNIDEMEDFANKKIVPGYGGYIEFLGNGKVKMKDSEGTYKNGKIFMKDEKGEGGELKIDSITDCLYVSVFENGEKNGEIIFSKDGNKSVESNNGGAYDFRKVTWGMNQKQVLASEKGELRTWSDDFVFVPSTTVAGLKSSIGYLFFRDTLINAGVKIEKEHSNKNDYIADYNELIEVLNAKYGEGDSQVYWKNSLYKGDVENYGMAISAGHLVYYTTWKTDNSYIELALSGENYEIDLRLKYFSNKYEHLLEQRKKEKNTSGL